MESLQADPHAPGYDPRSEADFYIPDEEDAAALAEGRSSPEAREAIETASRHSPECAMMVARARRWHADEQQRPQGASRFRRWPAAAAAVAAALVLALFLPSILGDRGGSDGFESSVRAWVVASAEGTPAAHPWVGPFAQEELAKLDPGPNRGVDDGRWLLRGRVLGPRPELGSLRLSEPARLVLYRMGDQSEIHSWEAAPGASLVVFPAEAPDLDPEVRYGLELRGRDGTILAHADFIRSGDDEGDDVRARAKIIEDLVADAALRDFALGHFFIRQGYYAEAVAALSRIPASPTASKPDAVLKVARRLLGAE
jgi:hypothetical protein